jgi:serine/threonine protein kinase
MRLDKLGRYEILQELGSGALGSVFLANDPERSRRVAIKTLDIVTSLPPETASAAIQGVNEAVDGVWRLSHPNIVSVLEVHEVRGVPCIVEEYVDGPALSGYLGSDTLLPPDRVIELVARAAEALDHAHACGVVHGDIKPQNLLRVGDSGVKITDFRLAAVLRSASGLAQLPGELPGYFSPEQARGRPLDARSDLFSLTAVLYHLLGGEPPFPGDSAASIVYRIVHEDPKDPTTLARPVSPAMARLLLRGLARSADDRCSSGAELARELREVATSPDLPAEPDAPKPADRRIEPTLAFEPDSPHVISVSGASSAATPAPTPAPTAHRVAPPEPPTGRRLRPIWIPLVVVLALAAVLFYLFREGIGSSSGDPSEVWWEASVRTEPAGLEVTLDGVPLETDGAGATPVRFRPEGPFGTLNVTQGCRSAVRQIAPGDAGGEIVIVLDPIEIDWRFESQVLGAELSLGGQRIGVSPSDLRLDLCTANQLSVEAPGYRPATLEIPAGATPTEARRILFGLSLERIPIGKLAFKTNPEIQLVFYVDGDRLGTKAQTLELAEGQHEVRFKNEYHFIDERRTVRIPAGETVTAELGARSLATLVVQAFPSNCKVFLRRPGGGWRYVDETPAQRRVAVGRYEVKVELNPTGETIVKEVDLVAGGNPPLRVSFGKRG